MGSATVRATSEVLPRAVDGIGGHFSFSFFHPHPASKRLATMVLSREEEAVQQRLEMSKLLAAERRQKCCLSLMLNEKEVQVRKLISQAHTLETKFDKLKEENQETVAKLDKVNSYVDRLESVVTFADSEEELKASLRRLEGYEGKALESYKDYLRGERFPQRYSLYFDPPEQDPPIMTLKQYVQKNRYFIKYITNFSKFPGDEESLDEESLEELGESLEELD